MASNKPAEATVLIASDDAAYAGTLASFLALDNYATEVINNSQGVLRLVSRKSFNVIVLDLALSEQADVDLVSYIRRRNGGAKLILLFEVRQFDRAMDGIRRGAYFYLPKSSPPSDVVLAVSKALRSQSTEATVDQYEQTIFEDLVGGGPKMKRIVEMIRKVAPTDSTVLLLGESGTGKEVLANAIHRLSARRDMPFIAINCAALPENLLESEMFGHVKGAFTGATADKPGLFEEADGGTIFLDEVAEMALITQAKLLRVLQNGDVRRVGATVTRRVNVRVIAATNQDLEEAVATNAFREDLYFRLNVIQIRIPPLRERIDALGRLVHHFVARFNEQYVKNVSGIDDEAQALLRDYQYPGNVRELESIIAHAIIMADDDRIRAQDLPDTVREGVPPRLALPHYEDAQDEMLTIQQMEERLIRTALKRLDGNQTEAAKRLGISRSTLWRKMKEYRIGAA